MATQASLIKFRCPSCDTLLGVSRLHAGQSTTCPQCQRPLRVPGTAPVKRVATEEISGSAPIPSPPPAPSRSRAFEFGIFTRQGLQMGKQWLLQGLQMLRERKPVAMAVAAGGAVALLVFVAAITAVLSPHTEVQEVKDPRTGQVMSRRSVYEDSEGNFVKHGPETEWYPNGQKKSEVNYSRGKKHGTTTGWYENGQKQVEERYSRDKKDGLEIRWYANGQKQSEETYKEGELHGPGAAWDNDGHQIATGHFQHGKKHGTLRFYAEGTTLSKQEEYKDGVPHGEWFVVDATGQKTNQYYIDGYQEGPYTKWHANGQKMEEGEYKQGRRSGRWRRWDAAGNELSSVDYSSADTATAQHGVSGFNPASIQSVAQWAGDLIDPLHALREDSTLQRNAIAWREAWDKAFQKAETECQSAAGQEITWSLTVVEVSNRTVSLQGSFDSNGNFAEGLDSRFRLNTNDAALGSAPLLQGTYLEIGEHITREEAAQLRSGAQVTIQATIRRAYISQLIDGIWVTLDLQNIQLQ